MSCNECLLFGLSLPVASIVTITANLAIVITIHLKPEETKEQKVLWRLFVLTQLVNAGSFTETQTMGFPVAVFPAKPTDEILKNKGKD